MAKTVYTDVQRIQDFPIDYTTDRKKNFEIVVPMIIQISYNKSKTVVGEGLSSFPLMVLSFFFSPPIFRQRAENLTETELIGVLRRSDLREGSESKCALHFAYVIVQNRSRAKSLSQLETVDYLQ